MGLKNNVNMEFINRIFRNLKAKYISVVDTHGIVGDAGNNVNLQSMCDALANNSAEISLSATQPTDPAVKLWIPQTGGVATVADGDESTEEQTADIIPFINDKTESMQDTWSSHKIAAELESVKTEMALLRSMLETSPHYQS